MRTLARLAAFIYYRVDYRGGQVPPRGPALLVANHPNSLLDPMLVVAAAGRPVRFLAKAPLFTDPKVAWLMRLSRSIPVHRRQDDPSQVARNLEMFEAVHQRLGEGEAVAIFPEGISHSGSSLAAIRTGAARIALGAAVSRVGGAFPVIPIGIDLRDKTRFRSEVQVYIGAPIEWSDLAQRGADDADAVRDLTARIEAALRELTVNLDDWHDAPLVDTALAIWESAAPGRSDPATRALRRDRTTRLLREVRNSGDAQGTGLAADVERHRRRLAKLNIDPEHVELHAGGRVRLPAVAARLLLLVPIIAVLGVASWLLYVVPYRFTGWLVDRFHLEDDTRSTWKLMLGAVVYLVWTVAAATLAGLASNVWLALAILVLMPAIGVLGLLLREDWRQSWRDARRWLMLRSRPGLVQALRDEQRRIAAGLDDLRTRLAPETMTQG